MKNLTQTFLWEQAVEAWTTASKELGFRIKAPYTLSHGNETVECLGFLPHFGGPNGLVIGASVAPSFDTDKRLIEYAKAKKIFFSFVNLETYKTYNEGVFKEALTDWGFFGPSDERPSFFN